MKAILTLLIILAAGYFAWDYYQKSQRRIAGLEAELAKKETKEKSIPSDRVSCPTCKGEGQLSYKNRSGRNKIYSCKICMARGYNVLSHVVPGAHLCPDCLGMGRIKNPEKIGDSIRIGAARCARCMGRGWIKPKFPPGNKSRTPLLPNPRSP